jgi:hypothetical protein
LQPLAATQTSRVALADITVPPSGDVDTATPPPANGISGSTVSRSRANTRQVLKGIASKTPTWCLQSIPRHHSCQYGTKINSRRLMETNCA